MKVAIISINRSASTAVSQLFAQKYSLLNYGEVFLDNNNRVSVDVKQSERPHSAYITELLQTSPNFVCKLMISAFIPTQTQPKLITYSAGTDYSSFDFSIFDKLIFTQRAVVDQIASILSVNTVFSSQIKPQKDSISSKDRTVLYENYTGPVDISDSVFNGLEKQFDLYREIKAFLYAKYPEKCGTVSYEMLQQEPALAMSQFSDAVQLPFTATDYLVLTTQKTNKDYKSAMTNYAEMVAQIEKYNLHY